MLDIGSLACLLMKCGQRYTVLGYSSLPTRVSIQDSANGSARADLEAFTLSTWQSCNCDAKVIYWKQGKTAREKKGTTAAAQFLRRDIVLRTEIKVLKCLLR